MQAILSMWVIEDENVKGREIDSRCVFGVFKKKNPK